MIVNISIKILAISIIFRIFAPRNKISRESNAHNIQKRRKVGRKHRAMARAVGGSNPSSLANKKHKKYETI